MTPGADSPVGRERPATRRRRLRVGTTSRPVVARSAGPHRAAGSAQPTSTRRRPQGVTVALLGLVAVGAAIRWLAGLAHVVPYYMPDEYIYSALARGIAESGEPVVRGATPSFPALLEPMQTSLFYVLADIETAVRLTQALHALEMSLAAVPVFLLARRLELSDRTSLACAAVAITVPALYWAPFTLADPVGYTLALWAVYAAVRAVAEPTITTQAPFVVVAGLATFARTQYAVLFAVVLAAALVVERGSVRLALARQWLTAATTAAALLAFVGAAVWGALGPYSAWLGVAAEPDVVAKAVAVDALTVALAAGLVVVPGAIVALDLLLSRPRSRVEQAFAAIALFLGGALAGLASLGAFARVQERYLVALTPIPVLLFAVWVDRGMPRRRIAGAIAAVLAASYVAVELAAWDPAHSPTLHALRELESVTGTSLLPRLAPVALLVVATTLPAARRGALFGALALTLVVTSALSIGAYVFDRRHAEGVRETRLPARKDWVDAMGIGDVAILHAPRAERAGPFQHLYWNEAVGRVLELPGADELDFFAVSGARVEADGTLLADGEPVTTPILAPLQGTAFTFAGARLARRTHGFDLVRARGRRLTLETAVFGRYRDGWLEPRASIRAWPGARKPAATTLRFVLSLPATASAPVRVGLSGNENGARTVVVEPGATVPVSVQLAGASPLRLMIDAQPAIELGDRRAAVRISRPRLR